MAKWRRPLAVAVCCAYPLLNHAAAVYGEPRLAALGVALVVWALASGWLGVAGALLVATPVFALSLWAARSFPSLLLYAPPLVINLALCVLFASTLFPGRDPLVTGFARMERAGPLPSDLARYTRSLTGVWAGFFALMATISAILAATGPLAAWSLFTNLLNYLLVVLLFVIEYAYRRVRYRHHAHLGPWQMMCRMRDFKVVPRSRGQA
jgi:uncharacterized membrane protein